MGDSSAIEFWVVRGCFILAAVDAAGFTIVWLWSSASLENWKIAAGGVIGAAIVLLLVGGLRWADRREDKGLTKLIPGAKNSPVVNANCKIPEDALAVYFGSNVIWGTSFPIEILNMGGTPMLEINKKKNSNVLEITVLRIFDDRGDIIARIDSNGFWTEPSVRRKKPNKHSLIVYDRGDQEVLHAEFINPRALSVTGIFRDRRGMTATVTPEAIILPRDNRIQGSCFGNARTAIKIG